MGVKRVGPGSGPPAQYSGTLEHCSDGALGHPLDCLEIAVYRGNYSAFNGYAFTPSDYSAIRCECGAIWRTKASYVEEIRFPRK